MERVTNGPGRIGNHFTAPLLGVWCPSTSPVLGVMVRIRLPTVGSRTISQEDLWASKLGHDHT